MFLFVIKINILNIHTPKINILIINNIKLFLKFVKEEE